MKYKFLIKKIENYRLLMRCKVSFFAILIIVYGCKEKNSDEKWRHVELQPLDKSQTITIITQDDKRYFINGVHKNIPSDGYLLVDMSKVDPLGDGISVCWNDSGHKWKIASAYAKLVENKLDTSRFLYYESKGKLEEPVSEGLLGSNCGGILIRENLKPRGNLIVNYIVH